jgi:hypothetical protein
MVSVQIIYPLDLTKKKYAENWAAYDAPRCSWHFFTEEDINVS